MTRDIGTFGLYTFDFEHQPASLIRDEVQELDELGWRGLWFPEVGGREAFSLAGLLLAASERMHVVNGIATVTAREAWAAHGGAALLADAHPDRHLLGLGVSAGRPGTTPLTLMNTYLDELDAFDPPVPRVLAAYGPRMLAIARDRAIGAHTYHVNVAHTAQAREILGPDRFLAVEHAVLFETDPARARAVAREHLHPYLTTPFNVAKFRRLGYTEDEIAGGGNDRIVDDLVFWGEPDSIADRLRGHLDAGADHVAVQVIGVEKGRSAMPFWRLLGDVVRPPRAVV
ncbi:TIGR03620 family F420-dependent LLM class oxidoreductase [Actinophytocola sp. NPDC049390]|uniref:TIGR03620 family F420-dependent LLM class oxidoreductase n=1 Tax=Actinophytocola sp. NPDC049390 TaxID=3363894 RepID=UPI00378FB2EB